MKCEKCPDLANNDLIGYNFYLCLKCFEKEVNDPIFECCKNKSHEINCQDGNCKTLTCHICPKKCYRCDDQATVHALSLDKKVNLCDKHKPKKGEEWAYYHPELTNGPMMMVPHVFDLKTKKPLLRGYYWNGKFKEL